MSLHIHTRHIDDVLILYISGRILGKDSNKFRDALHKASLKSDRSNIVVDLSDVQFLDSFSIGTIIVEHTFLTKQEPPRTLMIVNNNTYPFNYVGRILEFLSVDKIVPVHSFYEEAIGSQFNKEIKKIQNNLNKRQRFMIG